MIAAVCSALIVVVFFLGASNLIRSLIRQHARERELLLNQIMHLSGKTWTPPPAHEPAPAPTPRSTIRSPEQYPDEALA